MNIIRPEPRASNGWNNGDLDVALQLFRCGMVWDGNLVSKSSRDHLYRNGYCARADGYQALTGKGIVAFLTHRAVWAMLYRRWRRTGQNPFVADTSERLLDATDKVMSERIKTTKITIAERERADYEYNKNMDTFKQVTDEEIARKKQSLGE